MDTKIYTTLITGASSGIGLHLAHEFASHGHPLILVAPDDAELQAIRIELMQRHGVQVDVHACDLEDPSAIDALLAALADRPIDVLVNNAGHGQRGRFWEIPLERHLSLLRLNVEAVLRLTSHLLPPIVRRNRGGLLNVASVAGFEPGPMLAVYHATKAFVLSWSEALATELKDTDVAVTALCPGPTDTDFFEKADMEESRAFQQAALMAPQEVAKIGYDAFVAKERVVIAGTINKMMTASRRLLPEHLQAARNEKMYEDAPKHKRDRGDREDAYDDDRAA